MFHAFPRTNSSKVNQCHRSHCDTYWSDTYKLTRQSQSVRRHRSWSVWSRPDIYCTRKSYLPKSHKHNEIFGRSMKRYSAVLEILREIVGAINFIAPSKKIRVKTNSEPWFDNQIVSATQKRDKLFKKFKYAGLETDKDNFKVAKMHLQKMILKKKKSYFEEELGKGRKKPKELWNTLSHLL